VPLARAKPFPGVTEIALMVTDVGWLLASVTDRLGLVLPTTQLPKLIPSGIKVTGSVPVAEKVTVCGLLEAVVFRVSVPVGTAPRAVGLTVTAMEQVAPEARVPEPVFGHVLLAVEIAYGPPVTAYESIVIEAAPVFLTVISSGVLVTLMATFPKLYDEGDCVVCAPARTAVERPVTTERVRIASVLREPRKTRPQVDITIASVACFGKVICGT
jgi:hypothetical protein